MAPNIFVLGERWIFPFLNSEICLESVWQLFPSCLIPMLYPLFLPLLLLLFKPSLFLQPASYICLSFPTIFTLADSSSKPALFLLIAIAPKVELSFPPPHAPFPGPYFKISAPVWFIHHITFIFSYLIPHFLLHLLQLANKNFWLALSGMTLGAKHWIHAKQAALKAQHHHFVENFSSNIKK